MLGQHVVNHRAVFVALGLAVGFNHRVDRFHQLRTICKTQFLDQKVVLDGFKLAFLARRTVEASAS